MPRNLDPGPECGAFRPLSADGPAPRPVHLGSVTDQTLQRWQGSPFPQQEHGQPQANLPELGMRGANGLRCSTGRSFCGRRRPRQARGGNSGSICRLDATLRGSCAGPLGTTGRGIHKQRQVRNNSCEPETVVFQGRLSPGQRPVSATSSSQHPGRRAMQGAGGDKAFEKADDWRGRGK